MAGYGCRLGRQCNKRGVEAVIGDHMLKILIMSMFFLSAYLENPYSYPNVVSYPHSL